MKHNNQGPILILNCEFESCDPVREGITLLCKCVPPKLHPDPAPPSMHPPSPVISHCAPSTPESVATSFDNLWISSPGKQPDLLKGLKISQLIFSTYNKVLPKGIEKKRQGS